MGKIAVLLYGQPRFWDLSYSTQRGKHVGADIRNKEQNGYFGYHHYTQMEPLDYDRYIRGALIPALNEHIAEEEKRYNDDNDSLFHSLPNVIYKHNFLMYFQSIH